MCVHTHTYNTSDGLFVGQNKKVFVDLYLKMLPQEAFRRW